MKTRIFALLILVAAPTLALACSVPVFRYALERWELSKYEIVVFYERVLPADLEKSLKALEADATRANIKVVRVDLQDTVAPEYVKQWAMQTDKKTLPWLSARLPETSAKLPDAWAGPFTQDNLRLVLDSPARRKLVKHLSEGTTAVFLLLPGQDEAANAKAADLLDKELARLTKVVQLPAPSKEGPQITSGVPLKVEFTTLKLDRADPAEQAFLSTLLNTDSDLAKVRGPIVLPVFGRGRLLCSLFGQDLNREHIADVVRFLCGDCSCTIKQDNPGVDLLIAANWTEILAKAGPAKELAVQPPAVVETKTPVSLVADNGSSSPPSTDVALQQGFAAFNANGNVVVPPSVSAETPAVSSSECCVIASLTGHPWLFAAVAGAGVLVLATGIWVFFQRK